MIVNEVPSGGYDVFTNAPTLVRRAGDTSPGWLVVPLVGEPHHPGDSIPLDMIDALPPAEVETVIGILQNVDMDLITEAVRKDTVANLQHDPQPTPRTVWFLAAQAAVEALLLPIVRKSRLANGDVTP